MKPLLIFTAVLSIAITSEAAQKEAAGKSTSDAVEEVKGTPYLILGPMVGHTSPNDARIWVKASRASRLTVRVAETADLSDNRRVAGPKLEPETEFAGFVVVDKLKPSTRYYYTVLLNNREVTTRPYPSFQTPPQPGSKGVVRFAFTSCSGYQAADPGAGMTDLGMRTNIDLLLLIGDNHYGNSPLLAKQRAAYRDQRSSPGYTYLTSHTPTYSIWDDHDFGPDNSDGTLANKDQALRAFKEHWANPADGEPGNPGVYYKFSWGDVDFIMLDGRYHRSPNKAPESPEKTMLGRRQMEWFKQALLDAKGSVKVLVSGGEWQSNGSEDSWASFKREEDEIFSFIDEHKISGVILISGDRHFTGAYQVRGRFIEVTSGPIGGNMAETRNLPEMFINQSKGRFYCVYDIDTRGAEPAITLEIYRIGTGRVERRPFTWDEVMGRTKIKVLPPSPARNNAAPRN